MTCRRSSGFSTYDVMVGIVVNDDADALGATVDSVLAQEFDNGRIKLTILDNGSACHDYDLTIGLANQVGAAFYRLNTKLTESRALHKLMTVMSAFEHKYLLLLRPGDVLYPRMILEATAMLEAQAEHGCSVAICEADVDWGNGTIGKQPPLFEGDCIFNKAVHCDAFLMADIGHRIMAVYRTGALPESLPEYPFLVRYTDAFMKAISLFYHKTVYMTKPLARVRGGLPEDAVSDLILRAYLVKRIEYGHKAVSSKDDLDAFMASLPVIFNYLARAATTYAQSALALGQQEQARDLSRLAGVFDPDWCGRTAESLAQVAPGATESSSPGSSLSPIRTRQRPAGVLCLT